jgi:hypothetical protein
MKMSILAISSVLLISGCATTSSLPPEKQREYSLLVPAENTGGMVNSTMISNIDGQSFHSLAGTTQDVLPGQHNIAITSCFNGGRNCIGRNYAFATKAGLAYVFRGPDGIEVYDRFNMKQPLDTLARYQGSFIPEAEARKLAEEAAAAAQAAVMERRKKDLPKVRKIGTNICQEQKGGIVYSGFVEALAEEKVQIRISSAYHKGIIKVKQEGFTPSIIWDSPLNWDLCE